MAYSKEELIKKHQDLHGSLDELIADWLFTGSERFCSKTSLLEFMQWSHAQTHDPECYHKQPEVIAKAGQEDIKSPYPQI